METERLILRPFAMDDAEAMYRNWARDPEVTRFMTWPSHDSAEVSRAVLADWLLQYENPDASAVNWAIVPKAFGEPIGSIGTTRRNEKTQCVEIGYCIGRAWWHRGVMSEAFAELIRYLITECGVNRVTARHDLNNPHSGMVMAHCGLKREGVLRQDDWNNQGICDCAVYGLLASEYQAR